MPQLPELYGWRGTPPDPLAHPELYDGLIWRRLAAYVFDCMAIGVVVLAGWVGLTFLGILSFGLLLPLVPVALGLLPLLYHAVQVGGRQHATLGMRLFDLQVFTWDGELPEFWQGFLMAALFYATLAFTGSLIMLVVCFNDRRRTVHDYLSGVVVVRRSLGARVIAPAMPVA